MSILQSDLIDSIGTDKNGETVILTISDHLTWVESEQHLLLLQEKLNTYISFYESGELFEAYPKAVGKKIVFDIVGKYPLSPEGDTFLSQAKDILENIGVKLKFTHHNIDSLLSGI